MNYIDIQRFPVICVKKWMHQMSERPARLILGAKIGHLRGIIKSTAGDILFRSRNASNRVRGKSGLNYLMQTHAFGGHGLVIAPSI